MRRQRSSLLTRTFRVCSSARQLCGLLRGDDGFYPCWSRLRLRGELPHYRLVVSHPSALRGSSTNSDCSFVAGTSGSEGSGNQQFSSPSGVAVDAAGDSYVADQNNHRVQKCPSGSPGASCMTVVDHGDDVLYDPYDVGFDEIGYLIITYIVTLLRGVPREAVPAQL